MQILFIFLLIILDFSQALVTYQSIIPLNATTPFSGLKLDKESIKNDTNFSDGITICIRFNYRQLNINLIIFFNQYSGTKTRAGYQRTFLDFGGMNWMIKDLKRDSFHIWSTNRWHSLCVSFDKATSHIAYVKV